MESCKKINPVGSHDPTTRSETDAATPSVIEPIAGPSGLNPRTSGDAEWDRFVGPLSAKVRRAAVRNRGIIGDKSPAKPRRDVSPLSSIAGEAIDLINIEGLDSSDNETSSVSSMADNALGKRKRGRPPTTGEYVGLARAKRQFVDVKRAELDCRLEEEVVATLSSVARAFRPSGEGTVEDTPMTDLLSSVTKAARSVEQVSTASKGLKGTNVKSLKTAVGIIRVAIEEIDRRGRAAKRAEAEAGDSLGLPQRLLRAEERVRELTAELEALKGASSAVASAPAWPKPPIAPKTLSGRTRSAQKAGEASGSGMDWELGDQEDFPPLSAPRPSRRAPPPKLPTSPGRGDEASPNASTATANPLAEGDILQRLGELVDRKLADLRRELLPVLKVADNSGQRVRSTSRGGTAPLTTPMGPQTSSSGPKIGKPSLTPTILPPSNNSKAGGGKGKAREPTNTKGSQRGKKGMGHRAPAPAPIPGTSSPTYRGVEKEAGKPPSAAALTQEGWTTVVKRGGKGRKAESVVVQGQRLPLTSHPRRGEHTPNTGKRRKEDKSSPKEGEDSNRRAVVKGAPKTSKARKVPRTAAVTITCQPGAYEATLREAKSRIDLRDIGAPEGLKVRRTRTGALSLEISGEGRAAKADALAAKMRELFEGREDVKIARPFKTAELRVTALDDGATAEEVAAAIAEKGGCPLGEVKTGLVKKFPQGLGAVWLRCPLAAANKVVAAGHLVVGWTRARVALLPPRPLQCYKCMEGGHVRAACPNEADRSAMCYRCGDNGHKAQECAAGLRCPICAEAGRPSGHRAGSAACVPTQKKGKGGKNLPSKKKGTAPGVTKKAAKAKPPAPASAPVTNTDGETEAMEVEETPSSDLLPPTEGGGIERRGLEDPSMPPI